MTAKTKSSKSPSQNSTNKQKGNLVEEITAMLHGSPNVKVERNVFLPTLEDPKRKREIDVLLTSNVSGYSVRLALECKNEGKVLDVEYIDSFIGKLDDIGIPHQHGIFISASGYTSGATKRAKAKGIRTLVIAGLTKDRIASAVTEAWQYTIFLLPVVNKVSVITRASEADVQEITTFFNKDGAVCGFLPDLIWFKWKEGGIKPILGETEIEMQMPAGWQQIINGKFEPPAKLIANIEVIGYVLTLEGKVRQHSLIDSLTSKVEKFHLNADFDTTHHMEKKIAFKRFLSERKLQAYIGKHNGSKLINRVMLPRLHYLNRFYYPWSERVAGVIMKEQQDYEAGKIGTPATTTFYDIEGKDLRGVWEPIWQGHFKLWKSAS